jgi:hypothetical protein
MMTTPDYTSPRVAERLQKSKQTQEVITGSQRWRKATGLRQQGFALQPLDTQNPEQGCSHSVERN